MIVCYSQYSGETQLEAIAGLIEKDLSEPYTIFTYRYFLNEWPNLTFVVTDGVNKMIAVIICRIDTHHEQRGSTRRGYIGMLAVDPAYRKNGIGSTLVTKACKAMKEENADEVVLETEVSNKKALALYDRLGFIRDKRINRYYLNGVDAIRLKLALN